MLAIFSNVIVSVRIHSKKYNQTSYSNDDSNNNNNKILLLVKAVAK